MTQMPPIPLALPCGTACAGFPSPAADHVEPPLDLSALLMGQGAFLARCDAPWACGGDGILVARPGSPRPGETVIVSTGDGVAVAKVAGLGARPHLTGGGCSRGALRDARVLGIASWALRPLVGAPPAEDRLDGLAFLVDDRAATYLFKVAGWSMRDAGVDDGDIVIVDRAMRPAHGHLVLAVAGGARTVKRLLIEEGKARLSFDNPDFPPFTPPPGEDVALYGVLTWILRRLNRDRGR